MRRLLFFILTSLFFYKDLSGQCPDRSALFARIAFLKGTTIATDDQVKELLPYVHQLELCPTPADSTFASLLQRLGLLYFLKKDYPAAVNYTRRAIRLLDEKCPPTTTKPILLSRWYYNLTFFYDSLHQKRDFIEALDSSITIAIRIGVVDSRTLMALWHKASYYYDIGDYDRCYRSALLGQSLTRKYLSGKDSLQFVHSFLTHSFNALHQLGRYDQMETLLKEKIREFSATTDTIALGIFMNQLSSVYREKHNYKEALECLRRSYLYNESVRFDLGSSQALNNTGDLYLFTLHDYDQALIWCRKALARLPAKRNPDSFETLEALTDYDNIASAYAAKGNPDSALVYFQLAFDQLQPGMNETVLLQRSGDRNYESKRIEYLSRIIIHKGDAFYSRYLLKHDRQSLDESIRIYKKADLFLERAINEQSEIQSQLAFRKNARNLYEHAIRSAMEARSPDEAFYFFERSRAILLNDQLQRQANLDDKALAERAVIQKNILRLEREMEGLSPGAEAYAKLQANLFSAKQDLDRYNQAVQKREPAGRTFSFSTLPGLRARLGKERQSFFALYAGDSSVYSILVNNQDATVRVIGKSRFDSLAHVYTTYISDPERLNRDMPGFVRTAGQLYQLLFPDGSAPPGRVVVSPDGNYFPFEALVTNNSVRHPVYFLDSHPICYTYSARYFLDTAVESAAAAGKEFMGIAPVQYASYLNLPDLPGSSSSLDQIASLFGSPDKFTSGQASKASFLQNFSDYRLIQLYTHAVGNSPGKEPLIYFADSALALSELIPEKKPLTRLIVLSACETANGEFYQGEGVFSFNREFAALGIPAAVVNCWSVDNKATYQLTELFFKYLSQGQPADIALQQAKKEFIRHASGEQRLPYYWAASVLTGQATLIPQRPSSRSWLYMLLFPAALLAIGFGLFRFSIIKR
ncbi:MAG TPA: CHAT domain-containing protein [Puia sp.]|jgi:tetratricopeptide (TPR) repeat protein